MASAPREDLAALSLLADPVRRSLYEHVARAQQPVTRDAAASAVGISRGLAAFHLDKLVDAGLVEATYARPAGAEGAGRPPKVYAVSGRTLEISLPPRRYDVIGDILLDAVSTSPAGVRPSRHAEHVAEEHGRRLGGQWRRPGLLRRPGRPGRGATGALQRLGYEPARLPCGDIRLRNCPFHHFADRDPELVCGVNLAFVRGLLDGLGETGVRPVLEPVPGECCVTVREAGRVPDPAGLERRAGEGLGRRTRR